MATKKDITVYADTSVFGGVFDEEFERASKAFFDAVRVGRFLLTTSEVVRQEVAAGPEVVRELFDDLLSIAEVAAVTAEILEPHGIRSFAIGFGDTSGDMARELNAIAENGGTPFTSFIPIQEEGDIQAAFDDIASNIASCIYDLAPPGEGVDEDEVNFYFETDTSPPGGEVVGFDPTCTAGWRYTDDTHLQIEFCGPHCQRLMDGEVNNVVARFGCETILI